MNNFRIGNNITLTWRITRKGIPENLDGKVIEVYILDHNGRRYVPSYTASENVLTIHYLGKDQRKLGPYTLMLICDKGTPTQVIVDKVYAFSLVPFTYLGSVIDDYTADLTSDVSLPVERRPKR